MALNTAESLAEKQRGIKVGSRVCALQSGKYTLERGTVTADEGMSWRIKFDRYDEISVPKRKVVRVDNSVVSCNKQHYVWFAPWSTPASKAMDDIKKKVRGAKSEGANILLVKDEAMAKRVYDLARKARVPAKDVKIGYNSYSCARNAEFKVGDKVKYWVFDKKVTGTIKAIRGDKAEVVAVGDKTGITYPIKDLVAANSVCSRNAVVANALNACGTARNAFTATQGDVNRLCNEGLQAGKKLVQHVNEWMATIRDYQRNPNLQDKYAEDEYKGTQGLVKGFKDALRAMGW